jgi:beta-lactamase class A
MNRQSAVLACAGLLIALGATPAATQEPHRKQLAEKLQRDLKRLADAAPGVVGVAVVDIATGQRFGVNDALVFPQGSAIKIPILIELFRRADREDLRLGERLSVRAADRVDGSGLLRHFSDASSELSLHDLAILMIVLSDNTATNLLIDRLGMDRVSQTMSELGASGTRLRRKMIRPEDSAKGNENVSTPREAADLMVRLARCDLPLIPASCAEVKRILEIPKSGPFRQPIPASVAVAWKPGGVEGVQTAWGLVGVPGAPYAISVMVNYGPDDIDATVREISSLAYRHFAQVARTTPHGVRVPLEFIRKSGATR